MTLLAGSRGPQADERVASLRELRGRGKDELVSAVSGGIDEIMACVLERFEDQSFSVRREAAEAAGELADFGDTEVVDALLLLTEDENDYVRVAALEALPNLCNREAHGMRCRSAVLAAIVARCPDDDPDVREAAISSLSKLACVGDKTAIDLTLEALEDSSQGVSSAAIDGLIRLGDVFDEDPGDEVLFEVKVMGLRALDGAEVLRVSETQGGPRKERTRGGDQYGPMTPGDVVRDNRGSVATAQRGPMTAGSVLLVDSDGNTDVRKVGKEWEDAEGGGWENPKGGDVWCEISIDPYTKVNSKSDIFNPTQYSTLNHKP